MTNYFVWLPKIIDIKVTTLYTLIYKVYFSIQNCSFNFIGMQYPECTEHIFSLEGKGSNCILIWLVVKPFCFSNDDISTDPPPLVAHFEVAISTWLQSLGLISKFVCHLKLYLLANVRAFKNHFPQIDEPFSLNWWPFIYATNFGSFNTSALLNAWEVQNSHEIKLGHQKKRFL